MHKAMSQDGLKPEATCLSHANMTCDAQLTCPWEARCSMEAKCTSVSPSCIGKQSTVLAKVSRNKDLAAAKT